MRLLDGRPFTRPLTPPWTPGGIYDAAATGAARVSLPVAKPRGICRGPDGAIVWPPMPEGPAPAPRRRRQRRETEPMPLLF